MDCAQQNVYDDDDVEEQFSCGNRITFMNELHIISPWKFRFLPHNLEILINCTKNSVVCDNVVGVSNKWIQ